MKKLLALLGVVTLTTNVVVAGVSIANADKNKQNDIKILQSKLQTILNSKTDARWDVSELQKKVDEEIGQGEITVSFKDYAKVKGVATVEFIFKANNKKYTGELSLTQTYTVKENIAEDISTISTRLTSILFEKSHDEWTVTDLQTEINAEYGAGEITVSGGIYSDDNNYTGETKKKAEFTFKGNATTDPQNTLKYKGEIALTHTYTKQTVISNEQIKTVVDDLASHAKFDDKQTAKTAIEVAFAYKEAAGDAESTGIKGIEKAVAKYNKSVVGDKSSFTVTLTLSTGYVLEQTANTVEVTVNLMSRTDISTNNEFKQELTSFVNDEAHKNQAWTKDGLQSALNTKYGSGEFVVTEDDSTVTYDNSELGKKTEKFVITGQGSKENNKQYQGELKVTHDYKVTANISTIKTGLQEILNNDAYEEKTWTLDELQKTVDNKFGKGQITVSEVVALKDDNSNVVNNTKEWKFIGNSNDENEFVYTGGVILTHTWKSYKVLASDIQAAAEAAVNGKSYATIEAAQEGITNAVEAITGVDSVIYPTETPKDWSDETIKFTVTFIENYVIEGKNDFSVKARVGSDITVSTDAVNNAIKEVVNAEGVTYGTKEEAQAAIQNVLLSDAWKDQVTGVVSTTGDASETEVVEGKYSVVLTAKDGHQLSGEKTITGTFDLTKADIKVSTDAVNNAIKEVVNAEGVTYGTKEEAQAAIQNVLLSDAWKDQVTGVVSTTGEASETEVVKGTYSVVLTAKDGHQLNGENTITGTFDLTKADITVSTDAVNNAIKEVVNAEGVTYGTKEEAQSAIEGVLLSDAWKDQVTGVVSTTGEASETEVVEGKYSVVLTAKEGHRLSGEKTITGTFDLTKADITVSTDAVNNAIKEVVNAEGVTYGTKEEAQSAIEGVLLSDAWKDQVTGVVSTTGEASETEVVKGTYSVVLTAKDGHQLNGENTITGTFDLTKADITVSTDAVNNAIKEVVNAEGVTYGTKEEAQAAIQNVLLSDAWKDQVTGVVTTTGDASETEVVKGTYSVVLTAKEGHQLSGEKTITGTFDLTKADITVSTDAVNNAIKEVVNAEGVTYGTKEEAQAAIQNVLLSDAWKDQVTGVVSTTGDASETEVVEGTYSVVLTAKEGHQLSGEKTITGTFDLTQQEKK